jgi:RNA polymerase sigma factor (sigma-70 family)
MMDAPTPLRPNTTALTPAQHALLASEPDTARRAASAVLKLYGPVLPMNEMVQVGEIGAAKSARSYDPARGRFGQWVYYHAFYAILDAAGVEGQHAKALEAVRDAWRGRVARLQCPHEPSLDKLDEPDPTAERVLRGTLDDLMDDMAGAAWMTGGKPPADPEEALLQREEARALQQVLQGLSPSQRELLALHYHDELSLNVVAENMEIGYRTLLTKHIELIALMRARLRGLGVTSLPAWFAEPWEPMLAFEAHHDSQR